MTVALMLLACLVIGASMGLSGIGGFLIAPAMLVIARASVAEAVLAALVVNFVVTSAAGSIALVRRQVLWSVLLWLAVGSVVAALGGGWVVQRLTEDAARLVVAAFLAAMGVMIFLPRAPRLAAASPPLMALLGAVAQVSAVLAGVGGPAITVPGLSARGEPPLPAIGTGLVHGVLVSGIGIVVILGARPAPAMDPGLLFYSALVVGVALLVNIARARFATPTMIRYVVGASSIVGSAFTLVIR